MATFDFKELVAKAHFQYVGPAFPIWWQKNKTLFVLPSLKDIGFVQPGQKYFTTLALSYKGEVFNFPNEPLISFSLAKTIVQTPTVGRKRKGAVLEYITTENYRITIRGICINPEDVDSYPTDQVDLIKRMVDIDDALEVVANPFFELFGIRKLVIENIDWDEMAGQQSLQKYTISAISDQDFYADLKERDRNKLLS